MLSLEPHQQEFYRQARQYVASYAKPRPLQEHEQAAGVRPVRGFGYGHATTIMDHLQVRQRHQAALRQVARHDRLTEQQLHEIGALVVAHFDYDLKYPKPLADRRPSGPRDYIILTGYYDRANVAELAAETVAIALGQLDRVKSLQTRYSAEPLPERHNTAAGPLPSPHPEP